MITAGIDCGAKNTKAVVIKNGKVVGRGTALTGFDHAGAVEEALKKALKAAGLSREDVEKIGGTGSGSESITMADCPVNDMKAIARAALFFFPRARTVVDVGAEEARSASVDEKGSPVDFALNQNCAAGAGAFIETMARALEVSIDQMGPLSLKSDKEIPINSQCVIFAESEVVGLIHAKTEKHDICKAIHDSMANRIASMISRIGINEDVVMIGGVGYNTGFTEALRRELKLDKIYVPEDPEYGASAGAALVAAEEI